MNVKGWPWCVLRFPILRLFEAISRTLGVRFYRWTARQKIVWSPLINVSLNLLVLWGQIKGVGGPGKDDFSRWMMIGKRLRLNRVGCILFFIFYFWSIGYSLVFWTKGKRPNLLLLFLLELKYQSYLLQFLKFWLALL